MRFDVKKYLFVGLQEDKEKFFKAAQEAGIIHFINLDTTKAKESSHKLQEILKAIKILRGLPSVEQEETEEFSLTDKIVHDILTLKNSLEELEEEERVVQLEVARIASFGNFSLQDIDYIQKEGHRTIQFFCARKGVAEKTPGFSEFIYVGEDHGLEYFIAINPHPKEYEGMVEMKIDRSKRELKLRLEEIKKEHHLLSGSLKTYAKYSQFLHQSLVFVSNNLHLEEAKNSVRSQIEGSLFVASGFVPVNKLKELDHIASEMAIQMEEISIEAKDSVPTYLENEGVARLGEDLIGIYDTPSSTDKDPSLWVLLGFAVFFAFIVGDAGYGAVFLGFLLYLRFKYPNLSKAKKRLLNLCTLICSGCVIWGILATSFFGISVAPENPLRKVSLIHWLAVKKAEYHIQSNDAQYQHWIKEVPKLGGITDPETFLTEGYLIVDGKKSHEILSSYSNAILLELALLIGVIHLSLGLLRYARRNWTAIGWTAFLIGGYLYFPYYLSQPSMANYVIGVNYEKGAQAGLQLMVIGVVVAVVLAVIKNGIKGLGEIMSAVQIFADALSYLRLYALGLAGAIVASTINSMADSLPFVFAIILIVAGHLVNMLLGVVGGLIHGLRLNFLEWYHYSFEGGGRKFKPLEMQKLE